jgi:hypothetical protein
MIHLFPCSCRFSVLYQVLCAHGCASYLLLSASDLEEKGLIDKSQKGVLKDLIISGDAALQTALDKYDEGDSGPLVLLMQQGLLDRPDSLDLLKDLDLNILSVGLEGADEIFFGEMDLHESIGSEQVQHRTTSSGSLQEFGTSRRKGSLQPMPLCDDEIGSAGRGSIAMAGPPNASLGNRSPGGQFGLDDMPFDVSFDHGFPPLGGITNLDVKTSGPVSKSVGPMPIKGEEVTIKGEERVTSDGNEPDILSGPLDSMGFNLQFQFPFNDDLGLDLGGGLKTELHDIESLSEPNVKPRAQVSPRTALANTSASITIPKLPPRGQGDKRFVGAYSPDSRARRIDRFMEKRKHRVWTKTVKYDVRKNFADTRMRVKGRFVKKDDEALLREIMALA